MGWINDRLGAPVDAFAPPSAAQAETLAALAEALRGGEVRTLVTLDCNPVATAPGDLGFVDLMQRAPFRVHFGLYFDETAATSTWHAPTPHPLESWSDIASPDGAVTIVQPLIRPLRPSYSAHNLWLLWPASRSKTTTTGCARRGAPGGAPTDSTRAGERR